MDLSMGGHVAERTSVERLGSVTSARQLDARRQTQVEFAFEAVLETSAAGGRRLLDALANGTQEWVLSASDGSCTTRVRLRCAHAGRTQHQLGGNALVVDWTNATLERSGSRVTLSRTELRLLAVLLDAGDEPSSRSELIDRVWPRDELPSSERENALAVYICSLRKRLGLLGIQSAIETVRGYGYRMKRQD